MNRSGDSGTNEYSKLAPNRTIFHCRGLSSQASDLRHLRSLNVQCGRVDTIVAGPRICLPVVRQPSRMTLWLIVLFQSTCLCAHHLDDFLSDSSPSGGAVMGLCTDSSVDDCHDPILSGHQLTDPHDWAMTRAGADVGQVVFAPPAEAPFATLCISQQGQPSWIVGCAKDPVPIGHARSLPLLT
jgi:hypothetical protein